MDGTREGQPVPRAGQISFSDMLCIIVLGSGGKAPIPRCFRKAGSDPPPAANPPESEQKPQPPTKPPPHQSAPAPQKKVVVQSFDRNALRLVPTSRLYRAASTSKLVPDGVLDKLIQIARTLVSRFDPKEGLSRITVVPLKNGGFRLKWFGPKNGGNGVTREVTTNGSIREGETHRHLLARFTALVWYVCKIGGRDGVKIQIRDDRTQHSPQHFQTLEAFQRLICNT